MKLLIRCFLGIICLTIGAIAIHRVDGNINAIELKWDIPFLNSETGVIEVTMKDSCQIYYCDSTVVYKMPYTFVQLSPKALKGNTIIDNDENVAYSLRKYKYYAFKLNDSVGFLYDSLKAQQHHVFEVRKFLRDNAFTDVTFYDSNNDLKIASNFDKQKSHLIDTYITPIKPNESYCDTTYFFYNKKMNDISFFSFSKNEDSLKKMKLYKMVSVYNEAKNDRVMLPKRVFTFSFSRHEIKDKDDIANLFNRFEIDYSTKTN